MKLLRILNCISYIGIFLGYLFTGWITCIMARCFRVVFDSELPGKPLPDVTECLLAFGRPGTPIIVNAIVGLAVTGLLFFLEFGNERRKAFLPLCLTVAFTLIFVQVSTVLEGVGMPYFFVTYGMTDGKH
jgi:hypothetical protein